MMIDDRPTTEPYIMILWFQWCMNSS